ncbi:MAG: hypothetical protein KDC00_12185, partial [Flavobacteriales bacterium]|nr:hypothetical protein [Flavobacteriales bacterium]
MSPTKRFVFRSWPMLAMVLMAVFIGYGLLLVSRSRELQRTIDKEVHLLDDLNRLNDAIHQLGLTHRMDVGTRQFLWHAEMEKLQQRVVTIAATYSTSPGMDELPGTLETLLHQCDSLHHDAMADQGAWSTKRPTEAVFQFMLQRAQKAVDRAARSVHEQGLATHTSTLSGSWDEARFLLIVSCLLAIVFAWLVNVSNKLLQQSNLRSQQLDVAKMRLERTNRELRETMLSKEEKEVMLKEIHHRVK